MPGVLRKLLIFAAADGLIIQSHSPAEPSPALRCDYKTRQLTLTASVSIEDAKSGPHLESHGIIGILHVAARSFLIAITRREQVAQILGKPIYVISDVALLPFSSKHEAEAAVSNVHQEREKRLANSEAGSDSSDGESILEPTTEGQPVTDAHSLPSPSSEVPTDPNDGQDKPAIAEEVFACKLQYGSFASQWLSRRGWAVPGLRAALDVKELQTKSPAQAASPSSDTVQPSSETGMAPGGNKAPTIEQESKESPTLDPDLSETPAQTAALARLPKLLRSTRLILSSRSFYFAYDYDITRRLGVAKSGNVKPITAEAVDPLGAKNHFGRSRLTKDLQYFWNRSLGAAFTTGGHSNFLMPIMQGFVGQAHFIVKRNSKDHPHTEAFESLESVLEADKDTSQEEKDKRRANCQQSFLLTLISRRSTKRSGLRYLRRGIDDNGNCANTVETEQVLSSPTWDTSVKVRSFVQLRGSIPLFFSQTPYSFKPVPVLQQSASMNQAAFEKHFDDLRSRHGSVQIALLVDKHGGEAKIGEEYQEAVKRSNERSDRHGLGFEWFDFHNECRGMKFENVDRLVKTLGDTLKSFGETILHDGTSRQWQTGVIRANCMDCLDRTNVAQCAFAQDMLQRDLEDEGFEIDLLHDDSTRWFNGLWADNGDAISRQYASTAALKGDYTRTRKRNYRGALTDLGLTLTRYYRNMFDDFFSQAVIDVLLGNVSPQVFEDFESNMMSADPGISIDKIRQHAIETCRKIVIQAPDEDLIHAWPVLSPSQPNTLRTLPFEESVLLLTDFALYGCKFDWTTEKILAFEKIDLRAIRKIHYGAYITSTFTEREMDERLNVGIAITYTPGAESVMRVNTRSLQNAIEHNGKAHQEEPSRPVFSWLGSRSQSSSRTMAQKLILPENGGLKKPPLTAAREICEDIQGAIRGDVKPEQKDDQNLIVETDIISLEEARKRVGYVEQLGHTIRKMVWT